MAILPIEIFTHHIFLKLPIKSLLCFKSVCRQWNHLLRDPQFVRMHLHHTTQQDYSQKLLLYTCHPETFNSLDHHQTIGSNGLDDALLHFPLQDVSTKIILGSFNGLVCVSLTGWEAVNINNTKILLWNPSTRDYKVLPPNPNLPIEKYHSLGFAYDSIADDYKIVRIVQDNKSRIDVYSLKKNSWKSVIQRIPSNSPKLHNRIRGCSLDGSLYWLGYYNSRGVNNDVIICFDLKKDDGKKLIGVLTLPRDCDCDMRKGFTDLKLLGGCLGIYQVIPYNKVVMWMMMKKNDNSMEYKDQWTKIMITESSSLLYGVSNAMLFPISLLKDGKILLQIPGQTRCKLVLYDPKTKSIKDDFSIENPCVFQDTVYIETLISPTS